MDKRGGLPKRGGKGRGVLTIPWREGSGTRGGETFLPRGAENGRRLAEGTGHLAGGGGHSKDSRIKGNHRSGEEKARPNEGLSRPTGGGRGRLTKGPGVNESATERGKSTVRNTILPKDTPPSRGGDRIKSAALISASEALSDALSHIPAFYNTEVSKKRAAKLKVSSFSYATKNLTPAGPTNSNKRFMQMKPYNRNIYKSVVPDV